MTRWPLIVLALTSCTTFSDLEQQHPFDDACEPGFVENEAGECLPDVVNNENNTENNTENNVNNTENNSNRPNNTPCEPTAGQCCSTADGDFCCTEDGCCYVDPGECVEPPPNNTNPFLNEYMLVIADAEGQSCADQNGDGPDIFGVRVLLETGEPQPYLVTFQPGPGTNDSEDQVQAVLQQFNADNVMECPQGESFTLGCDGLVGIGFESDQPVDITATVQLTVLESGPQCDQGLDRYALYLCPRDNPDIPNSCIILGDSFEGSVDQDFAL